MQFRRKRLFSALLAVAILINLGLSLATTKLPVAHAQEEICTGPFESVSPALTDLGSSFYVRMDGQATTFQGGLYPDGSNQPPAEHFAAGLEAAAQIQPRDADGNFDPQSGKIVMISLGMSNTASEFGRFMEFAHEDSEINPKLVFVNGGLGGQTADRWVDPEAQAWIELDARLAHNRVSPEQVQVAWVKQTLTRGGEFPAKAQELQAALEVIAHNLKDRFPKLQIAFYSSRTRSYTYWRGLSPEPLAFETGFSVRWMIEKQIDGDPDLNYDPQRGEVKVPFLAWGPYLWADGLNPRSDGLVWTVEDLTRDCTHPTDSGKNKVANMLSEFFKSDPLAQGWFLANPFFLPTPGTISPTFQSAPTNTLPLPPTPTPRPSATLATLKPTPTPNQIITKFDSNNKPGTQSSKPLVASIETDRVSDQPQNTLPNWLFGLGAGLFLAAAGIGIVLYRSVSKS